MKKILFLIGLVISSSVSLCAEKLDEVIWEAPRVNQLLPDLVSVPAVDFALPKDYICVPSKDLERCKQLNYRDSYLWGPKDVIEDAFKDSKIHVISELNPKKPILEAQISLEVTQVGEEEFSIEKSIKNRPGTTCKKFKWGEYPVLVVSTNLKQANNRSKAGVDETVYVGLNYASHVLKIRMISSKNSQKEKLEIWETFLSQTKPLGILEACKSHGQELKEGTTIINLVGSFLKVVAEQRISDGEVQVAVVPYSEGITFEPKEIESLPALETVLGSEFDGKLIKMNGMLKTERPAAKHNVSSMQTVNVIVKKVEEFSINSKEWTSKENVKFFCSKDITEVTSHDRFSSDNSKRSLAGKIENGLYYSPSAMFICKAEDFGQGRHIVQEDFSDTAASISFADSQNNFIKTDVISFQDLDPVHPEALKKTTKEQAIHIMQTVGKAQGIEVIHEEIIDKKCAFSVLSVEKMDLQEDDLKHSLSSTIGYLTLQHKNKIAILTLKMLTPYGEKHDPKGRVEALKSKLLLYQEDLSFPISEELEGLSISEVINSKG